MERILIEIKLEKSSAKSNLRRKRERLLKKQRKDTETEMIIKHY